MSIGGLDERIERTEAEQEQFDAACVAATEASALRSLAAIRDTIDRNDGAPFCSGPRDARILGHLLRLGLVSRTVVPHPAGAKYPGLLDRVEWILTPAGVEALEEAGL
jgi:hypothetical protein